jgi:hypothetical protein
MKNFEMCKQDSNLFMWVCSPVQDPGGMPEQQVGMG